MKPVRTATLALLTSASACCAQTTGPLDASWFTLDGGGTMHASGGDFEFAFTIGQPDTSAPAAPMTGEDFALAGGFWPGILPSQPCYANCDQSTTPPLLNVNDFVCFQSRFAAGDPYANCDGSTSPPILNVNDFVCFVNQVAAGCP